MLTSVFRKVFGTANDRVLKKVQPMITVINEFEGHVSHLSDEQLKGQTDLFKKRLADGESLENLLPEAFATVREAAKRVMGHRHFDVQLMGGLVLHRGMIAEMKTGEGKTLVATAPVYLNALTGRGVHVVTVNDYLAKRDAEWMGKIYNFLGLSVGSIVHGMNDDQRREAYAADITYGTNNEFGFDYLRDNMKFRLEEMCQRELHYAIVDEVDNILIDEARTPLIISGPSDDSSDLYVKVDRVIPKLEPGKHYEKDEKANNVTLTEDGTRYVEELVRDAGLLKGETLYDLNNVSVVHHINQALKAHTIFQKDKDYIINDGEIIIIDEFTGRMAEGRRYSDGLHQAIEAKERVDVQVENQTLASITYQNYFRLYDKLAGMTGTAETDATEFAEIYKLDVVVLPTNKPLVRKDLDDEVYRTNQEKYEAIFKLIEECRSRNQPILVGTTSIEKSEMLANMLKTKKIPHSVLNARYHEQEAEIIAQAGIPGAITIATNMAGRGTDIKLGGNVEARIATELAGIEDEAQKKRDIQQIELEVAQSAELVRKSGGLYIIGTERHESRRIDNQLRGRAGRQGDPGMSKFFLSLEDDLMRIFGSNRLDGMLQKLGLEEGEAIIHPWVNRALEKAQQKIEARNFDIRKQLLRFDDVMNDQRKVVYEQRRDIMEADDISETIEDMRDDLIADLVARFVPEGTYKDNWMLDSLKEECWRIFNLSLPIQEWAEQEGVAGAELIDRIKTNVINMMKEREEKIGSDMMRFVEKNLLLRILDGNWKDHLLSLDHLRQGIHLRAYGQRDPLNEYKAEAFSLFQHLLDALKDPIIGMLCHFELGEEESRESISDVLLGDEPDPSELIESRPGLEEEDIPMPAGITTDKRGQAVSRNSMCPCGSGKRYKHCHGR